MWWFVVRRLVRHCLISRLLAVFIWFILKIDYSIKDLGVNVADPEAMDILVTLILSYIFVGIMPLYAINLDVVSLFAISSFTFLAVLNDVISRFEWMNIILFLSKKKTKLKDFSIFHHIFHPSKSFLPSPPNSQTKPKENSISLEPTLLYTWLLGR